MPPHPNAHVRAEMARQDGLFCAGVNAGSEASTPEWDAGELAGYAAHDIEPWAWAILCKLSAWERGYLFGLGLQEDERRGAQAIAMRDIV